MIKKLLALLWVIFIILILPIGTFATNDAALNDPIIVTEMEFLTDNEVVLENPSFKTKKVKLECTNLYPGTKSNATIIAVAKDKTSKHLLKAELANQTFNIGDTKHNVSIDFDLSEQSTNFNNIDISFYIWSNGSIKTLSRGLTVDFATDLTNNELLYNNYNIYEVGGTIVANGNVTTTGNACSRNEIEVSCDVLTNSPFSDAQNVIIDIGNTNINDYIGKYCYIYFNINSNNEYEIVSFFEDTEKSNVIKITADMLDDASLDFESATPYIKYYGNNSSGTEVYLISGYIAIWNTSPQAHSYLTSKLNSSSNVNIEFIDIDNDNKYDIVNVYEYIHLIAQEVNTTSNKILTYNDINVVVDYELDVSIKDINGNNLTISDIQDKDVLAINIGKEGIPNPTVSLLKTALYDSLDIIVLKNNFVEGTVTQIADEVDSNNNLALSIDEIPYNFNIADKGAHNLISIALDAQGIFYIGIDGKIVGFEEELKEEVPEPEPDNTTGANGLAIVKSAQVDESVTNVAAYQNGEEIELIFDEAQYTQLNSNTAAKDFAFGTVFMYNSEAGGFVTEYTVIGQTGLTTSAKKFTFDSTFASSFETNIKEGEAFYHGYINMLSDDHEYVDVCVTSFVADGFTEGDYKAFNVASANQYSLTGTPDLPQIISGSYIYGRVDFADYDANDNLIGYNVFVRTYQNKVIDIISFDDKGHIITQ